jgi:hypothetical protein
MFKKLIDYLKVRYHNRKARLAAEQVIKAKKLLTAKLIASSLYHKKVRRNSF